MAWSACNLGWADWTLLAVLFTSVQMLALSLGLVAWRVLNPIRPLGEKS